MIEAVNSTIANATTARGVVGQIDSASVSPVDIVTPASGSDAAPNASQLPYVSPYISVDLNYNTPVLQIRDTQTGDVKRQFPTEARLTQIAATQAQLRGNDASEAAVVTTQAVTTTSNNSVASPVSVSSVAQTAVQTVGITTVQDVTVTPASNTAVSTPQVAVAALLAAAQSTMSAANSSATESSGVTVYA